MKYEVYITDRAARQLKSATKWCADSQSPQLAEQWHNDLLDAVELLSENPERFPLARENDAFPDQIREMFYGVGKKKDSPSHFCRSTGSSRDSFDSTHSPTGSHNR